MEPRADSPIRNGHVGDWRLSDGAFLESFTLPGPADKCRRLEEANPLGRDARIVFEEEKHEYYVDGTKVPRSVTGLVHTYCSNFDARVAVQSMKKGANWDEKKEHFVTDAGEYMSDDEIVSLWNFNGRVASARGTLLHWHTEMKLNGKEIETPLSPEFQQILCILQELSRRGLRAFRTEVCLFHCGLCLAGQADALFQDEDGAITILDWKRTKTIRFDNSFRSLREPLDHLPESNGWLYSLQLNVYKYMIETETNLRVVGMYLGQAHPSLLRGRLIELPNMDDELGLITEDQISRGDALFRAVPGDGAPFVLPPRTVFAKVRMQFRARLCHVCTERCWHAT